MKVFKVNDEKGTDFIQFPFLVSCFLNDAFCKNPYRS